MFPIKINFVLLLLMGTQYFPGNCTIITSVGNIFETFSPYAIVQFFEFSDKGWNISENCLRHMFSYVEGLRKGALWAVKLYDATNYYGGAAFGDSKIRIESSQICRDLLAEYRAEKAQPELLEAININSTVVPFPVQVIVGHYVLQFAGSTEQIENFQKIQQLICFPQSCNDQDLEQILAVQLFQSNDIIHNNSYVRHRIVYGNYSPLQDRNFYILIGFLTMALFVYTLAFLLQIYFSCRGPLDFDVESTARRSPLTANIESLFAKKFQIKIIDMNWSLKMRTENLPPIVTNVRKQHLEDFLSQISIQSTIYDLFQSEEDLPQLRVQFVFTILLIYGHLITEIGFLANNAASLGKEGRDNFIIRHSKYLFNGLLVLSASKLAFNYLDGSPRNKLNVLENVRYILKLVGLKILRHAPSYIFCLFAAQMLDRYLHTNIALEIPSFDYENCGFNNILSTIFYWDIFFPLNERCMPWAWIMSLEVQLFMVACLVLLLTQIQSQYASVIGIGFFFVSILGAILWDFGGLDHGNGTLSIHAELLQFNLISENIFLSIPPYLVGLYLGYILHKSATNIKLNLIVLILGYTGCIFIWIFFQYGFKIISVNMPKLIGVIVNVLGHIMWSLALMWIVLTSFSLRGDFLRKWLFSKYTLALDTLSPICLIISPILIRLFLFTADAPIYTSNLRIFPQAIGCILTTYFISFLLYVIFDGLFYTIFKASIR